MTDLRSARGALPQAESGREAGPPARLSGLDGLRGVAALFVVLHHCWLLAFPGFPRSVAPTWTGWLAYGHLAVSVFIVLSGFSLAVGPARAGWRLGGMRRFLRRRAWRILPPYWAALSFSLLVAWAVAPQPGEGPPTVRSVLVFGSLTQDVFGSPSPNGALWSIAIEAQLYLVLPLLLLVRRRAGAVTVLTLVALPALTIELLSDRVGAVALFERFVPQMAVLFAMGVVAAHFVGNERAARLPWGPMIVLASAPPIVLIAVQGRAWSVANFFWVDLAVGPAVVMALVGLSAGRPAVLTHLLDTRPVRTLGSFSYSLYLVHAPVVVATAFLIGAFVPAGLPRLFVLLATAVPVALVAGWAFSRVFELPFQRHRSTRELAGAVRRALPGHGRHAPRPEG